MLSALLALAVPTASAVTWPADTDWSAVTMDGAALTDGCDVAGSDWWEAVGDQPLIVYVVVMGSVEYLDDRGGVLRRITTADRIADWRRWCEASGQDAEALIE